MTKIHAIGTKDKLIASANQHLYHAYRRGADHPQQITNHCDNPFKSAIIDLSGNCLICICDAWLPIPVGNISDFDKLEDIWQTPIAKELQQTIIDKTFTYCAVESCGILDSDIRRPEYRISVNIDESCNLACPTCRRAAVNHTNGPVFDRKLQQMNHLVEILNNFEKPIEIILTGNGDPLASLITRPLVLNWIPKADQRITLFTNGLLLKKILPQIPAYTKSPKALKDLQISIDAGSAEVYEKVRAPGKYSNLIENLDWLHTESKKFALRVTLKFVVSAFNASDIVNFSNLCKKYRFNGEITKLDDWATFDNFLDYDVIGNELHEKHQLAIQQLRTVANERHLRFNAPIENILCNKTT